MLYLVVEDGLCHEEMVKQCQVCLESRFSPPAAPLPPREWPSKLWSRLYLDFAGQFLERASTVFEIGS